MDIQYPYYCIYIDTIAFCTVFEAQDCCILLRNLHLWIQEAKLSGAWNNSEFACQKSEAKHCFCATSGWPCEFTCIHIYQGDLKPFVKADNNPFILVDYLLVPDVMYMIKDLYQSGHGYNVHLLHLYISTNECCTQVYLYPRFCFEIIESDRKTKIHSWLIHVHTQKVN